MSITRYSEYNLPALKHPGQADDCVALMEWGQQIPDQEALLLEFPGFVKNPVAALDSFGGANAVSELLSGDRNALQLRFRPGDPLAHPLFGLKQQTKGLLLKVSRKAGVMSSCAFSASTTCIQHDQFDPLLDFMACSENGSSENVSGFFSP